MALPTFAWLDAEPITLSPEVEAEVRQEHVKLHAAMTRGLDGMREAFAPFFAQQAGTFGATIEEYIDVVVAPLFGPDSDYEVNPINPMAGEVVLFGHGRLVAIIPGPLTLTHKEWDEEFALVTYLWKDEAGKWQVIH